MKALNNWLRIGGISGIIGLLFYFLVSDGILPYKTARIIAFLIGPLLIIGFMGLYNFIKIKKETPVNQIAVVFGIAAGVLLNIMIVVQGSIKGIMYDKIEKTTDALIKTNLEQVLSGLHTIHFGLDVSFDIFIGLSLFAFGISLWFADIFNKVIRALMIILGIATIVLNLWTFPIPPAYAGLFDIGPIVAIYLTIIFVALFFKSFKVNIER